MSDPLDRSAAFTALLDLDPGGFGKSDMNTSSATITQFLEDFYGSGQTNMYTYAQSWLSERAANVTRLDPPPTMQARWEAQNSVDPGPTDRQLQDWAEHNAHADGLDLEADLE